MKQKLDIESTIEQVYRLIESNEKEDLEVAYGKLLDELEEISDAEDPYIVYVRFQAMAAIVRCLIYAKNEDFVRFELLMIDEMRELWNRGERYSRITIPIVELVHQINKECNDYYSSRGIDIPVPENVKNFGVCKDNYEPIAPELSQPHDCFLCNSRQANCKGSHLAPHFLIQPFLSFDSSNDRGKEIVVEHQYGAMKKDRKWGRAVPGEVIDETFGEVPDAEKVEIKPAAVTRDDLFCKECEKRFSNIENVYSAYFCGRKANVSPAVSYLFWLGVFWRLSVGDWCFKMSAADEEAARTILDKYMPYELKDVNKLTPDPGFGRFGYVLLHCANIKGEMYCVVGNHASSAPYKLLCGEYIVILYADANDAPDIYPVNTWQSPEQMVEIAFIDYWKIKRSIFEQTYRTEKTVDRNRKNLTDLAKGNHVDKSVLFPFGGTEVSVDFFDDKPKYSVSIPGSIEKIMAYMKDHPFDSQDEIMQGIENAYGYTKAEVEEMIRYFDEHSPIQQVFTEKQRERHNRRKHRSKQRQQNAARKKQRRRKK